MKKTLVVYFSRTGHTRKLAQEIGAQCGADVEAIEEARGRAGFWGYFRSGREALKKQVIEIKSVTRHPANYDLVVLGTPVWASNVSSPMRAYLVAYGRSCRNVAFFCAQGGQGADKVCRDMAELCGRAPIATAVFTDSEIKRGRYTDKISAFVRAIALPKAA